MIYQLRVTLLETEPPIWRRVLVPTDISLAQLHEILQAVFGWWNYHLHEFQIGTTRYGIPDPDDWDPPKDERDVQLASLVTEGSTFYYDYDPGDGWRHLVEVEKKRSADSGRELPACIDGRRACPPEDCGGPLGYAELLAILDDPLHPEHAERLSWLGGRFDPDAFDPAEAMRADLG